MVAPVVALVVLRDGSVGDLGVDSLSVFVPKSSSFSRKRRALLVESQGDVSKAGLPEDEPPLS